jgi:hypothetical protein
VALDRIAARVWGEAAVRLGGGAEGERSFDSRRFGVAAWVPLVDLVWLVSSWAGGLKGGGVGLSWPI